MILKEKEDPDVYGDAVKDLAFPVGGSVT